MSMVLPVRGCVGERRPPSACLWGSGGPGRDLLGGCGVVRVRCRPLLPFCALLHAAVPMLGLSRAAAVRPVPAGGSRGGGGRCCLSPAIFSTHCVQGSVLGHDTSTLNVTPRLARATPEPLCHHPLCAQAPLLLTHAASDCV